MKVLSLCDGMSVAHIALDRIGMHVDKYYAAEIKPIAIKVTKEKTTIIGGNSKIDEIAFFMYNKFI